MFLSVKRDDTVGGELFSCNIKMSVRPSFPFRQGFEVQYTAKAQLARSGSFGFVLDRLGLAYLIWWLVPTKA